jgi:hypothetical protein
VRADAPVVARPQNQCMELLLTIPPLAAASVWVMRELTRAESSAAAERPYSWMRRPSASMATKVAMRRARVSGLRASWTR